MFTQIISRHRRSAFVVVSLVSMFALGACSHSVTGPDQAAPLDGMRAARLQRVDYRSVQLRAEASKIQTRTSLRGF